LQLCGKRTSRWEEYLGVRGHGFRLLPNTERTASIHYKKQTIEIFLYFSLHISCSLYTLPHQSSSHSHLQLISSRCRAPLEVMNSTMMMVRLAALGRAWGLGINCTSSSSNSSLPTEPGILMRSTGDGYVKMTDDLTSKWSKIAELHSRYRRHPSPWHWRSRHHQAEGFCGWRRERTG
jgi:hypothetical protein